MIKMEIVSITISILALSISLFALIYTIFKDNKESIRLWCLKYKCDSDNNGYKFSASYIITNYSHKNVSIIMAHVNYAGMPIRTNLYNSDIFPINLSPGESHQINIDPQHCNEKFDAALLELKVFSSKNKIYSIKSICS